MSNINDLKTFGEKIKRARLNKCMTQDDLAMKVGYVSRTSIAKIEAGETDISQAKIAAIANALCISPAYLLGFEDEKRSNLDEAIISMLSILNDKEKEMVIDYIASVLKGRK